ncbi:DUF4238 domain-containing protein [Halioglobus maricola]|uniref:DUF4238 domain-containing protein n=1 Tax=Halioglobus maricola TaxID=2601894 RepID=UPI00197AA13C
MTSDNPVATFNLLMRNEKVTGVSGTMSKGLLLFLPLDPRNCIVLYNYDVYRVGRERYPNAWLHIIARRLVFRLNYTVSNRTHG